MTKDRPHELALTDSGALSPEQQAALGAIIQQLMTPVIEAMAGMMRRNSEALERLAAAQKVQSDRMEALEKQIRLNTLVTAQQVRFLNATIRERARELLLKREVEDAAAVKKLGNAIRRGVLVRYGVGALHDTPRHEYPVAIHLIELWNDALAIRDCAKEARGKHENQSTPAAGA